MLNQRRIQQMVFLISIALLSMGCSDESSVGTEVNTESGEESVVGSEIEGGEGPVFPEPKTAEDFGSPCASNDDCESGFCVEGPDGFICTQPCLEVCPEGFTCKAVSNYYPDVIFLCIPNSDNHCTPCSEDLQCDGGTCALLSEGSFCLTSCNGDDDCEVGNSCATTGDLEGSCVPTNASCTCIEDGLERSCEEENGTGVCNGIQTCDLDTGWSPCSATPASDEICDYQDNDCDGVVDNGFIGENGYDSQEHCGACNLNCNAVFPNAITTCNGELDTPLCVLVACEAGYSLLGDTQCVPSNVGLCEPCTTDENCVLDGSVCMDVGGASFCGTPCQTTTDCPTGFACKTVEPGIPQCYPNGESCTCTEDTPDLVKSCSVTWPGTPVTTCYGQQGCGTDGQWEECDLPEEVCDNQDNNCDGLVDEGFKDEETGQYLSIDNCGQCGNSCAFNSFENGEPVCDATLAVPNCAMACFDGFYDVNSNPNDGCECQWASDTDFPDVNGSDVNCDGIDGEVDNGVFVSKDGEDGNPGTLTLPVRTIQKAITIAFSQEKRDVYVATGIYQEAVFLSDNVHVYGGYRGDFLERDANLYESAILGPPPTTETPGAVHGLQVGVNGSCTFDGFSVLGGDAFLPGESSMGIYLLDAGGGLTISNNVIFGGNGANGTNGSNGASGASGTDGTSGVAGKNAGSSTCGAGDEALGGGGGSLSCGGVSTSGGNGGKRICPDAPSDVQNTDQISLSAEYGSSGGNNGISGGGGGFAGFDSLVGYTSCTVCSSNKTWQTDGYDGGEGTQGENGSGGSAVSALNGNFTADGRWEGPQSASGFDGTAGGGGGGGGAGGGVDISVNCTTGTPAVGGSGGGGGSGGCPGISGASGGPGGSSFGIFAWWDSTPDSYPQFTQNTITRGSGGQGGNGGAGGVGGGGGAGGAGGISGQGTGTFPVVYCGASGGYGGNGGNGGNGGGGAGGAGGLSFGAFMGGTAPTSNVLDSNSFAGGGAPGGGGVGGASYGNSGADGLTGNAGDSNL